MGVIPTSLKEMDNTMWLLPRYGGYSINIVKNAPIIELLPRYGGYSLPLDNFSKSSKLFPRYGGYSQAV